MKQRPFCDQRPSMKTNKLLVRTKVGKTVDTTYDLPPQEYRYGYQSHDDHGVAECLNWGVNVSTVSPSKQRAQSARRNENDSKNFLRRKYDGYDPRNPDRYGFDEKLCTHRVDPLVVYGPSIATTEEAAKAAGGKVTPLGTVIPPDTAEFDSRSLSRDNFSQSGSQTSRKRRSASAKRDCDSTCSSARRRKDDLSDTESYYRTDVEAITSPTRVKQPTGKRKYKRGQKPDFVKMNKMALKAGCVTAKEFREFQESNPMTVQPEENFKPQEDEFHRYRTRQMVHGIPTPPLTGVKDCLNWAGYKEAKERALQRRELQKMKKDRQDAMKPKGVRYTRAARGHSHKPDPPPSYADTFKIKRFRDIDHYAIDDRWD